MHVSNAHFAELGLLSVTEEVRLSESELAGFPKLGVPFCGPQ